MLNRTQHKTFMTNILTDIYGDEFLRQHLGFKGGTAAYLFYNLPRFSTDLDFDLLNIEKYQKVYEKVKAIASKYGEIKDEQLKTKTLYFRLSYEAGQPAIKIEISRKVEPSDTYNIREFFGLPVMVSDQECMAANKLVAVLDRKKMVNRDWFDSWFFLKNNWPINEGIIKSRVGLSLVEYFEKLVTFLEKEKDSLNILHGLGEVLDAKQKLFVKDKMLDEILFLLKVKLDQERKIGK